ncbi:hypothetical protein [Cytobacillus sp. IB215665]|uniref:hypothetical protein n=1 Tax=Cytobacillus sp. IB215665 TaxID=3097357 RepID=UPI002A0C7477|nr:hypothetical protein [Cytobacillus sp. IB215665]MDX8367696.1 hypothetical protein [Cytobacillus sp. IB215665]
MSCSFFAFLSKKTEGADSMDLFDFETEKSTESLESSFKRLVQWYKEDGNPVRERISYLPSDLRVRLNEFEEEGWIKFENKYTSFSIPNHLKDFYSPDERVDMIIGKMEKLYEDGNIFDLLKFNSPSCEFATKKDRDEFYLLEKDARKHFAKDVVSNKLALQYFTQNESSRGTKINRFSTSLEKEAVKTLAEEIIPISDIDEIEHYFKTTAFFCGICKTSGQAEVRVISPILFDIACLCEAKTEKQVKLIISYAGGSSTNLYTTKYRIVYPKSWSTQRYFDELTPELIDVMFSNHDRLCRLYGVEAT